MVATGPPWLPRQVLRLQLGPRPRLPHCWKTGAVQGEALWAGEAQMSKTILSLCDYSGNWSQPYADAGYDVIRIDLQHGGDVRLLKHMGTDIHGILIATPCTHFASSGARWWAEKGEAALLEGLAVADACLRAVAIYRPHFWALENPVGRLRDYLGPPQFAFDPCDFGDPYTKRTQLWGTFAPPHTPPGSRWSRTSNRRQQDAPHEWQ